MDNISFSNSHLITGADRGLGLAFVQHYLLQGKSVVATSRRRELSDELAELVNQYPYHLKVMFLDVADEPSIVEFASTIRKRADIGFDMLINNAGVCRDEAFGDWTTDGFVTNFVVNSVGPALVVQWLEPFLNQGCKIVQISSGMGSITWNIGSGTLDAYAASKCALNIISKRLAEQLRPKQMVVISMNPGWVRTDMGGANATTSINHSIEAMTATIERATMEQTGTFLASDGSLIPW